jgi:hypothetical protein
MGLNREGAQKSQDFLPALALFLRQIRLEKGKAKKGRLVAQ